jgi:hypothetical protein
MGPVGNSEVGSKVRVEATPRERGPCRRPPRYVTPSAVPSARCHNVAHGERAACVMLRPLRPLPRYVTSSHAPALRQVDIGVECAHYGKRMLNISCTSRAHYWPTVAPTPPIRSITCACGFLATKRRGEAFGVRSISRHGSPGVPVHGRPIASGTESARRERERARGRALWQIGRPFQTVTRVT